MCIRDRMIDAIAETEIPFFYVIGNHDLDLNVRSNEHARITYKSYYGPTYYSFNRGDIHYVVLDDIFFIAKSYLYVGYLTEQQLQDVYKRQDCGCTRSVR